MTQEYTTKLMNLTVSIQYVWDDETDIDDVEGLMSARKTVGTMFLDGKPVEALMAVLVGSDGEAPDDYDYVQRVDHEGKTYDLYVKWAISDPERSKRIWQKFVEEGKPHVKYTD